jgi:hypothetical protein
MISEEKDHTKVTEYARELNELLIEKVTAKERNGWGLAARISFPWGRHYECSGLPVLVNRFL